MISKILCNNIHYKFKNSTFHSANLAENNKKQILYCLKTTNFTSTVFSSWLPWKHNGSSENLVIKMYIQSTRCLALLVPLFDPCLRDHWIWTLEGCDNSRNKVPHRLVTHRQQTDMPCRLPEHVQCRLLCLKFTRWWNWLWSNLASAATGVEGLPAFFTYDLPPINCV